MAPCAGLAGWLAGWLAGIRKETFNYEHDLFRFPSPAYVLHKFSPTMKVVVFFVHASQTCRRHSLVRKLMISLPNHVHVDAYVYAHLHA